MGTILSRMYSKGILKILLLILFCACTGLYLKAQKLSPEVAVNPGLSTLNHLNPAKAPSTNNQSAISRLPDDNFKKNKYLLQSTLLRHNFFAPLPVAKEQVSENSVNWTAFTLTTGALAGIYTGLFRFGEQSRWDASKVPFHFRTSFSAQGIDKISHFYAAKTHASVISNLYRFSGLSDNGAAILGAGVALSTQSLVEVKDARVPSGGFDTFDEIANILGAGWFYARNNNDFLQRFNVRWFYYPSENREFLPDDARFTGDYNGHTYWLSMQMWDLLPEKMQPWWPKFIVPAAGISLNDFRNDLNQNGELSYHLSFNLDFKHIIPQKTGFGQTVSDFLNGFYIPAPALEVYPNPSVKLIFFGQQ